MALVATYHDPPTEIGADGFGSFTKLPAATANKLLENDMYLKARNMFWVYDFDGTVGSTTSTTFVDIPGASGTLVIPAGGGRAKITFFAEYSPNTIDPYITVVIDSTNIGHATNGVMALNTPNQYTNMAGAVLLYPLTAGSHTIKLQYRTTSGTFTVNGFSLLAEEA